jgi:hypothetical protein
MDFDAGGAKPSRCRGEFRRRARIASDHLLPAGAQGQRRRLSRASEAEHEERARRQRRARSISA